MAQDRIDSIIDRAAVSAEIDATKKEINDLVALIKSVKGNAVQISGAKTASEYQAINTELQKNIALTNQATSAISAQTTALQTTTAARGKDNVSLQQNIDLRKRLQTSMQSYLKDQKEDAALLKNGTITRAEYNKRLAESTVKVEQYKGRIKEVNKDIALQTRTEKQLAIERQRNARIEEEANRKQVAILQRSIDQQRKQSGAYQQLSKDYQAVALQARNFALTLGESNPLTIAATRNAKAMSDQLKQLDASVGITNRNVGNYTQGISAFFSKAFNGLRTLANIVPGLGLSGIILLLGTQFSEFFSIFQRGATDAEKAAKRLNEVNTKAIEIYAEQETEITNLVNRIKDENTSNAERRRIMETVNEKYSEFTGELTDINQLESVFVAAAPGIIATLKARAKAQAAYALAVEAAKDELEFQLQAETVGGPGFFKGFARKGLLKAQAEAAKFKEGFLKIYQDTQKDIDAALATSRLGGRIVAGGVGDVADDFDQKKFDEKAKKEADAAAKAAKAAADARLKTQFDMKAIELQQQIDFNKEIADNDKLHFIERFKAVANYTKAKEDLINLQYDLERKLGEKTALELELIELQRGDALLRLRRERATGLLKIEEDTRADILKDEEKLQKDLAKVAEEGYKRWKEIQDKKEKDRKDKEDKEKKDAEELARQKLELEKQLAAELTNATFAFLTANLERRKNALSDELAQLEINTARQIELAGNNADAIAIIEARAQIQKDSIARKQRELDIKKAQFDKAQAVARIIQETAVAIVKVLDKPALIPLVAAIGAAQLAQVLATPIPRYKDGGTHGGGPMIVGDGGRSEGIQLPDGTVIKSPDSPTLMNAPAGTVIHKDFNKMLFNSTMTRPVIYRQPAAKADATVKVIAGLKAVEKAISKIPQPSITVQNPIRTRVRYGHAINEHLKRNLGK